MPRRSIAEYRRDLARLQADFPSFCQNQGDISALSALAIVKTRSIRQGVYVDGVEGEFAEYSVNKVNTQKFRGKELSQAGRDFNQKNRLATWHDFRQAQGLTSHYVNLAYTLRMWTSMHLIQRGFIGTRYVAVIGTTDPIVLGYLGKLTLTYKNFINPTQREKKDLIQDGVTEFIHFLGRYL